MASIQTRSLKNSTEYNIAYRILGGNGKPKQMRFRRKDKKEAYFLLDEVAEAEKAGLEYVRPPPLAESSPRSPPIYGTNSASRMTISELLAMYVRTKSANDWSASTLKTVTGIIKNYIEMRIGSVLVIEATTQFIQDYYDDLPNHKAVQRHKQKAEPKNISARTVREIHKILRPAFRMATRIGIISINPASEVTLPKQPKFVREQWTEEELIQAYELCTNIYLRLFIGLMFSCTLRSGELAGLTWDCVDISEVAIAANSASIYITKEIRRLDKECIEKTGRRGIKYVFPNLLNPQAKSAMAVTDLKTDSSVRRNYLPSFLIKLLIEYKAAQEQDIAVVGDYFEDHGLRFVFSQLNGRPYDVKDLAKKFKAFVKENGLRMVDSYSLRHAGATAKLRTTGNIKAVQGDMGHASAQMLTNVYAAIVDEDRKNIAVQMDERLIGKLSSINDKSTPDESASI